MKTVNNITEYYFRLRLYYIVRKAVKEIREKRGYDDYGFEPINLN